MIARTLLAAVAAATLSSPSSTPLTYRFDEVKSSVTKLPLGDESKKRKVAVGDAATGGDVVQTGFFARTVVSVPERKTRFEIGSSSRARLQGDEPGVLLVLEKGRLKALFEALTDGPAEERRVATPGALLAVRGTRYGLEVVGGETTLVVFEGVVEVLPGPAATAPFSPVFVRAGEFSTFSPRTPPPPRPAPMRERGLNERSWDRGESPRGRPGDSSSGGARDPRMGDPMGAGPRGGPGQQPGGPGTGQPGGGPPKGHH